jgi:hypothetical protein
VTVKHVSIQLSLLWCIRIRADSLLWDHLILEFAQQDPSRASQVWWPSSYWRDGLLLELEHCCRKTAAHPKAGQALHESPEEGPTYLQFGAQILVRVTEREVAKEVAKAQKGASCLTRLRRLAGKGRWHKNGGRQPEQDLTRSRYLNVGSCSCVVQRWALLDACDFLVVGDFLCQHKETFLKGSSGLRIWCEMLP